jgi:predicted Holliday junction resolvase-like endonuclease
LTPIETQSDSEKVELGRREMRRRLNGLTRFYQKRQIALEDLKLVFDPVDYVAFRGLGERRCSSIEFIDCEATTRRQDVYSAP